MFVTEHKTNIDNSHFSIWYQWRSSGRQYRIILRPLKSIFTFSVLSGVWQLNFLNQLLFLLVFQQFSTMEITYIALYWSLSMSITPRDRLSQAVKPFNPYEIKWMNFYFVQMRGVLTYIIFFILRKRTLIKCVWKLS